MSRPGACQSSGIDVTRGHVSPKPAGVKLAKAFSTPDLDRDVKWHCKYARQNGIYASPTFMIDGHDRRPGSGRYERAL
jgi:hypothetical protein